MAAKPETYPIDSGEAELHHEPDGSMVLSINGEPSSHIAPGEPQRLDFPYMRWIADFLDSLQHSGTSTLPRWPKPRLTHLGGAACSLPRYFADAWPGSRNTVVEIDSRLAELARELFDVPRSPAVKIRVGDAREVTDTFKPATRDVTIRDVFANAMTPRELTTVEFYGNVRASISENGVYVANCGTDANLKEAKEELAGMCEVFPHVAAIADPPMFKGRRRGNIVLIGAQHPINASSQLTRALMQGAMPAHFKGDAWARKFATTPRHDPPSE